VTAAGCQKAEMTTHIELGEILEWTTLDLLAKLLFCPAEGHQWVGSE